MLGEIIARLLREKKVCSKAVVVEDNANCSLVACSLGEALYLVAVARHGEWIYARIVPEYGLPADKWTCMNAYYTPYGLYAFSKTLEELVEKIASKEKMLRAASRLAFERVAVSGET